MSYANELVLIPSKPSKITFKSLPSAVYVYLEIGRTYSSETKHTTPKRVTIGKLEDKYTGKTVSEIKISATHMYPNSNYFTEYLKDHQSKDNTEESMEETTEETIEDEEETQEDEKRIRSSCLCLGPYVVIKHFFKTTGIDTILKEILQEDSGFFMDLAAYSIICESNVAQHYPEYCYKHPLFTKGMRIYSDASISRFVCRITTDQIIKFQDKWNELRDKKQSIMISYDSTNKNTKAENIEKAEISKAAKERPNVPIVNYAVAYDVTNFDPLFFENYPGSNPDVGQLGYTLQRAKDYGYQKISFILDRGYFSEDNIHNIDRAGYDFIIMAKGNSAFLQAAKSSVEGTFERDRSHYFDQYCVYGTTYRGKLYEVDEVERYFHVFYHDIDGAVDREKVNKRIRKCRQALTKLLNKPFKAKPSFEDYEKYFEVEFEQIPVKTTNKGRSKGQKRIRKEANNPPCQYKLISFREKTEEINKEYSSQGYFVVVSSEEMTAEEAITRYKGRDKSEKLFLSDKSFLGNSAYRVYTDEAEESKSFIEFVASIIRNRIFHKLDDAAREIDSRLSRMTVPTAIGELEKIEIIRYNEQPYRLDHAVTTTQKMLLKAFDLSEDDVLGELKHVNDVLIGAKT